MTETSPRLDRLAPFDLFESAPGRWSLCLFERYFLAVAAVFREVPEREGHGLDWGAVCDVLIRRDFPELLSVVTGESETEMFVAVADTAGPLETVGIALAECYADEQKLRALIAPVA